MNKIENLSEFANKRYGQNFLKNDAIIKRIIQSIPNDNLKVAEIGPGLGDLTKELILTRNVTAFEVDKRLCVHLQNTFSDAIHTDKLKINCGDVLKHWEEGSLLNEDYHLVANLPYYIATNIILKALKDEHCQSVLVMVQKEVAEKFSAQPGEKAFSGLSVLTQTVGFGELLFDVGAENFVPPPKITSAILLICKNRSEDNKDFEDFLKVAFKQPRKKLSKNLSTHYPKDKIEALLTELGISLTIRPHEAETSMYHHLYNELNKDNIDGK
ncbi:MAG: SSU rRNA (adenine(1518)-N(6)/adenine(1519)-N(6))-dimethyltransferase (EC [uncultured Sulfurovum sp.]|uniref:Ribosomal RNA small subunit methyltransferase A n=1 Tax=uncultured Sulfurovum sp. TaxID=269237 RepID=A0A6S6SC14_9BACT|nr:MAG: SSU rRNA (adenine(1518)-N(6)/adenine(1519)-N(6))-dimethyltransferase (EC [uncultured Sulfurovum sp.]